MTWRVEHGDCVDLMRGMADASVDAVVCDPPYPEVDRPYGRMTVPAWEAMMHAVVRESRRVLKPRGSAVFVLQPNSERVGSLRPWLFDFISWCSREWNVVQDVWWWNHASPPTVHCHETIGLMRPSLKACVWVGDADCYRDQSAVLWSESDAQKAMVAEDRLTYNPSGVHMNKARVAASALRRGGVTPFNVLPFANADSSGSGNFEGHGAGTPFALCDWWVRYICPAAGTVLDMFAGGGTVGVATVRRGCFYVGIEREAEYVEIARSRINAASRQGRLDFGAPEPTPTQSGFDL